MILFMSIGSDTIINLGGSGGENDVLIVYATASVNATDIISFTALDTTQTNSSDASNPVLRAKDGGHTTLSVASATGTSGTFTLVSGDGNDYLTGGAGDDIIIIENAGEGDADTIDGGVGTDTLQLSSGTHTLTTENKLVGVENVTLSNSVSGTTIDLSNQTEIFTITGGNFIDNITSGKGDDTIDGGGEADSIAGGAGDDIITGGSGNDIITVDFCTDS